jgi:hypothetical protein
MYKFLFLKKTKISFFGGISKFLRWADFCKFGQFWAEFIALIVADSMPKPKLKSTSTATKSFKKSNNRMHS